MKKTILTFGLISGGILSLMMLVTIPFMDRIGYDRGEVIGYTSLILAFLLVFFGVRSYRDNYNGGTVSFGRAFAVAASIAFVASCMYVATWQILQRTLVPDFAAKYQVHMLEEERAKGATEAEIAAKRAELDKFNELYKNPLFNIAITFIEPLPIGLVVALISAGILRRRRPEDDAAGSRVAPVR